MLDPRLRGAPRDLYLWLHEQLDVVEYRPMTLDAIVAGLGVPRSTVGRALRTLAAAGYLDLRPIDGRSRAYRLVYALRGEPSGICGGKSPRRIRA